MSGPSIFTTLQALQGLDVTELGAGCPADLVEAFDRAVSRGETAVLVTVAGMDRLCVHEVGRRVAQAVEDALCLVRGGVQ